MTKRHLRQDQASRVNGVVLRRGFTARRHAIVVFNFCVRSQRHTDEFPVISDERSLELITPISVPLHIHLR